MNQLLSSMADDFIYPTDRKNPLECFVRCVHVQTECRL